MEIFDSERNFLKSPSPPDFYATLNIVDYNIRKSFLYIMYSYKRKFFNSTVLLRRIRRESLCFFRRNEKFGCSLKIGYAKVELLALLWRLYNEVILVGRSNQEEYQRWDQKNAQIRRESWKHYQETRKFLNFFLVNMKSDVMASIFMFTKNVREEKDLVYFLRVGTWIFRNFFKNCWIFSLKKRWLEE